MLNAFPCMSSAISCCLRSEEVTFTLLSNFYGDGANQQKKGILTAELIMDFKLISNGDFALGARRCWVSQARWLSAEAETAFITTPSCLT